MDSTKDQGRDAQQGVEVFARSDPAVWEIYECLLAAIDRIGAFEIEPKKTSIHLKRQVAFAGVHPRRSGLVLNLRLARSLTTERLWRCEQVSRSRFHNEIRIEAPQQIDAELIEWLREAYNLE
jgi:hypothetical protein